MKKRLCYFIVVILLLLSSCKSKNDPSSCVGELKGLFSVSASTQIKFSKGNLQYQASSKSWRFAENQYDVIGNANKNISASYEDWIDLFGWGTGNNPTNSSISKDDYPSFYEWGANKICNGGNYEGLWRTLTKKEWYYLFFLRDDAAILFGLGNVAGINGMIILPDGWNTPQNTTFSPSTSKGLQNMGYNYYKNEKGDNYSHNSYTVAQWRIMEDAGAVFLPAAGYRYSNTDVYDVGESGKYQSSTFYDDYTAYQLSFFDYNVYPDGFYTMKDIGMSVRLVR